MGWSETIDGEAEGRSRTQQARKNRRFTRRGRRGISGGAAAAPSSLNPLDGIAWRWRGGDNRSLWRTVAAARPWEEDAMPSMSQICHTQWEE